MGVGGGDGGVEQGCADDRKQVRAIIAGEALLVATIGIILGAAITGSTLVAVHTALHPIVTEPPTVIPWQLLLTIAR